MTFSRVPHFMRSPHLAILLVGAVALAGCSAITPNQVPDNYSGEGGPNSESSRLIGSALGSDVILGNTKNRAPETGGAGLGVNAYLWRGALDTLSFMPLASADPYGGVIITDWYANPAKADERFKATVYILDTRLRADGLVAFRRDAQTLHYRVADKRALQILQVLKQIYCGDLK